MYKYMFLITLPTITFTSEKFFSRCSTSSSSSEETYIVFIDPNSPNSHRVTNEKVTVTIPINNESPFFITRIATDGSILIKYTPPPGYEKTIYDFFKISKQKNIPHGADKHTEK